jgi:hypothetical protein
MPCRTNRLLPLLKELGYKVTVADNSINAIAMARHYMGPHGEDCIDETDNFKVVDTFQTGFEDNSFGAAICSHPFDDFTRPEYFEYVLLELRRICFGPIVVGLLSEHAINAVLFGLGEMIRRRRPTRGVPTSFRAVVEASQRSSLTIGRWIPAKRLVSRQWYMVLRKASDGND